MVSVDYSGNVIEWSDGEYARLQAIKGDPEWTPNTEKATLSKMPTQLRLSPLLMERAKERAKESGVSFNTFVESMLKVIVE